MTSETAARTLTSVSVHFSPALPEIWMIIFIGIVVILVMTSALFYRRGLFVRTACAALFVFALLEPSVSQEKRESTADVVAVIVDRSPSQNNGQRMTRTEDALVRIEQKLKSLGSSVELRVADAPADAGPLTRDTRLFETLDQMLADVPASRRAGAIFITDGQVHDVPPAPEGRFNDYGPLNVLLTGDKNEKDRRLVVLEAPSYGIVDQSVAIRYRVEDTNTGEDTASVIIRQDSQPTRTVTVPVNEDQTLRITVGHAGQNVIDMESAPLDNEITTANNRVPLIVNGVRDRLRVLLVSGQPHAGGRTWRDILTSDPGVDLVHFTILREPDKLDATPQNELSLIAFPFRELFEIKLYDFDLIIFDRYKLNRILPNFYFANIAKYVREGGALLEASGPDFATEDSVYRTDLKDILPAYPTGQVIDLRFRPDISEKGHRHPVTQDLSWQGSTKWGNWLRQVGVQPTQGDVLMAGSGEKPLLILNRVGEGRVAQLASDHIWLWARGYDGGGPQAELLRRLAHWLMKEPELEEDALDIHTDGSSIIIRRKSLTAEPMKATLRTPKGVKRDMTLSPGKDGVLEARVQADELGIYTVDDGTKQRFAIVGDINPPELRGVKTTPEILQPYADASGGRIFWLADDSGISPRLQPATSGRYGGSDWIGLRRNGSYSVTGMTEMPFMPAWLWAAILLGALIGAWAIEGRLSRAA